MDVGEHHFNTKKITTQQIALNLENKQIKISIFFFNFLIVLNRNKILIIKSREHDIKKTKYFKRDRRFFSGRSFK